MLKSTSRLQRAALVLATLAMLAGCASDGGGGLAGLADGTADAGYRDLSIVSRVVAEGEFVEVEIDHRSLLNRVEQVALIGPDGAWHVAHNLRRQRTSADWDRPHGYLGATGGSGGPIFTGIGITIPLGTMFREPAHHTRALVRVPDPAGYRADPARWQVAVVIGSGLGPTTTITRPAPAVR
jgi:hypothetical protein